MNHFTGMNTTQHILNEVSKAVNIVITAHKSPDGDSIGSSLALYHFLKTLDKHAVVVHPDPAPDFLHWVPGQEGIVDVERNAEKALTLLNEADLIFCLDYNHPSRVGDVMQPVLENASAVKVMIDHHLHPADFCTYVISKPEVCSTAQLVFEWIEEIELLDQLTPDACKCIYLGIMTDTGSFRFPSVSAKTHEIAAELIQRGLKHSEIHEAVYDTNTIDRIRLKGYCMSEKLVCLPNLPIAYASMSAEELNRFNYQKGDTEGIVNQILSVSGIQMAVLFTEKDGKIKISFRAKGKYTVNELAAAHFNGGGHAYASGGSADESLEKTIEKFVTKVKDFIPEA